MPANERLRTAILQSGKTLQAVADEVQVDKKTVERWIGGRLPYTSTRFKLAQFLSADETYLWPNARSADQLASIDGSEVLRVYPHRWSVPQETWGHLFDTAEAEIGILVYGGMFLADNAGILQMLSTKAQDGVRVRILLGDPESDAVIGRGSDEGQGESMAARTRTSITLFRRIADVDGVELRLHGTILYNSIFRADDQLLVNTHIYGVPATGAPVMHLQQIPGGGLVNTYLESFERVWDGATPLNTEV